MENMLLIYLTDHTAEYAHWIQINEAGLSSSQIPCLLTECPTPEHKTETIVLFPTEEMLLTTTTLPPTKRPHQATAALYTLEEKLAEDVLELYPIIFSELENNLFSVGIIRKALLEDWLQKFKSANIQIQYLLPDIFALPYQADHWTTLFFHHRVLVRTGLSQGFATQEAHYDLLINKQIHPEIISFKETSLDIFLKTLQENKLLLNSFNLLQGKYKQKKHWIEVKKVWRLPMLLGLGWLILWIGFSLTQYIILNIRSTSLDKQISTLYYQAYPEATSVNSPRVRIDQEITKLKNNQANQQSLMLIAKAGNVIKKFQQTSIQSINFRDNILRLTLKTKDFQVLEQIINSLKKSNLEVKQSDAAREADNVTATLSLKSLEDAHDKNG